MRRYFLLALVTLPCLAAEPVRAPRPAPVAVDENVVRPADLVFRRGSGLLSRAVLAGDNESRYSHVGLAFVRDGRRMVVHAAPGEPGVRTVSLSDFLAEAEDATLRRVAHLSSAAAARIVSAALAYDGRPFDNRLDLESDTTLYCTELVLRAFDAAGVRLGVMPRTVSIPYAPTHVLMPSQMLALDEAFSVPGFIVP